MLTLAYPHTYDSLEPARMRREEIWRIGESARAQIAIHPRRPKIEVSQVIARCKNLSINGLQFSTHWELGRPVTDDTGNAVLGAVEHDESWPLAAMIYVNGELIGDREELARSTSVHELGHAVFDVPAWIQGAKEAKRLDGSRRRLLTQELQTERTDWREWRANEFMGAFLTPRRLLHVHMHKRAAGLRIPLLALDRSEALPVVNGRKASFDAIEALAIELAELFGLSLPFMLVRLRKYGLISAKC